MIGSLRVCATPDAMRGMASASPSPSKGEGRIPFISVGDVRGDDWPQQVSMTKEAQGFIAQIEGPVCVLVCMGAQGADKVSSGLVLSARVYVCVRARFVGRCLSLSVLAAAKILARSGGRHRTEVCSRVSSASVVCFRAAIRTQRVWHSCPVPSPGTRRAI
jgi:hypothetical protein